MRLDLYLTKILNIQSRNKACELIKSNKVKCNGVIISKPSFNIETNCEIKILEEDFYVSRAAYKLKYFLEELNNFSLINKNALDIGSSTGGFTQILLANGVNSVTCVDVGCNQLHERIKSNDKIVFYEKTDIRDFKSKNKYDVVTCDVSFISVLNIIHSIDSLAKKEIILLFKPQFEVGPNVKRNKKGVVKDTKIIAQARKKFVDTTKQLNWKIKYSSLSKIHGKDGNLEELFYFEK